MGTIVRIANAFNIRRIHVIGRKQWNKRGAMLTDLYMNISYHADVASFQEVMKRTARSIIAVDVVPGAEKLHTVELPQNAVLVFGAEGPGLSQALLDIAEKIVMIEQLGSTRSINVGVAAGIAMYAWLQQHNLTS